MRCCIGNGGAMVGWCCLGGCGVVLVTNTGECEESCACIGFEHVNELASCWIVSCNSKAFKEFVVT